MSQLTKFVPSFSSQSVYELFKPIKQNLQHANQTYTPQAKDLFFQAVGIAKTPAGKVGILSGLLSYVQAAKARVGIIVQSATAGMVAYTSTKAVNNFGLLNNFAAKLFG